jgi:hypothetical protein
MRWLVAIAACLLACDSDDGSAFEGTWVLETGATSTTTCFSGAADLSGQTFTISAGSGSDLVASALVTQTFVGWPEMNCPLFQLDVISAGAAARPETCTWTSTWQVTADFESLTIQLYDPMIRISGTQTIENFDGMGNSCTATLAATATRD